jgi:hypothetical protein
MSRRPVFESPLKQGSTMSKTPARTIVMPRDARTGQIVTERYAKTHPSTTTVEKRVVPAPKKK